MDYAEEFDALIFDCDGTLSDSMPLHYVAWRETLAENGVEFSQQRFYEMGGMPSVQIVATLSGEQNVPLDAESVAQQKEWAFTQMIDQVKPIDAVCDIARRHHSRLPMAVASGSGRDIVLRQLSALQMTELFDTVVTAEDTPRHKPEPDVFLEAARRMGIMPSRCLVFEDSPLGIQAATAAGMKSIDVRLF